jgi:hypothetical protein
MLMKIEYPTQYKPLINIGIPLAVRNLIDGGPGVAGR